jgi:hypothetical protein
VLESSARPEGAATATSNTAIAAEITVFEIASFIGQFPLPVKTIVMDRDGPAMEKSLPLIIARLCKLAFFSKTVDSLAAVNLRPSRPSRK